MSVELADAPEVATSEAAVDTAPAPEATESQVEAGGMYDMVDDDYADPGEESVETETTAESETEVETPTDETPQDGGDFGSELLAQAELYGFTADDAKAIGSEDALRRAMVAMDRRGVAFIREELNKQAPEAAPAEPAKPAETKATAAQQAADLAAFEKWKAEVDPTQYDEDTLKLFNGLNDHYDALVRKQHSTIQQNESKVAALEAQLQAITGRFAAEDAARVTEQFDTFLNGLGEEYQDLFGKGTARDLRPDAPEFTNRQKLFQEMETLRWVDEVAKRKPMSVSQLAQRALLMLHGDRLKTTARKEVLKKVSQQRNTAVERPSQRTTRHKTGVEAAIARIKAFEKAHPEVDDLDGEI
jgi:hypothetical protein